MCAGSPSGQEISLVTDMEMARVFALLSKNPHRGFVPTFGEEEYEDRPDPGYQMKGHRERKGVHTSDGYQPHGDNYGYKYSYDSRGYPGVGYGGEGEREGRRERRYGEEDQKERGENCSSGSSGIEDIRRSRSGSAASLLADHEGGKERAARGRGEREGGHGVHAGSSASIVSMDSGIGGAAHSQVGERGRGEGGGDARPPHGSPFDFSKGLGSLIPTNPHTYDYQFER